MRGKTHKVLLTALIILMALTLAMPAWAGGGKEQKAWEFNLAPFYLWMVSLTGDMKTGPVSSPVDVEFDDIFNNLNGAFIFHFEAKHCSNWGFFADVNYLDIGGDNTLSSGVKQEVDLTTTLAEAGGFYRIPSGKHAFDLLAGARYVKLDTEVKLSGGPGPGRTVEGDKDFIDPIIGARWLWKFADQWNFILRGDVGGFGIGSDLAVQGAVFFDWQPFKYVSFLLGYRALYVDFKDNSDSADFVFDATIYGPVIGINFRW